MTPTVEALSSDERGLIQIEVAALRAGHVHMRDVFAVIERILAEHTERAVRETSTTAGTTSVRGCPRCTSGTSPKS